MNATTLAATDLRPASPWTRAVPTRPGIYLWRAAPNARSERVELLDAADGHDLRRGGEWAATRLPDLGPVDVCWRMYPATLP